MGGRLPLSRLVGWWRELPASHSALRALESPLGDRMPLRAGNSAELRVSRLQCVRTVTGVEPNWVCRSS